GPEATAGSTFSLLITIGITAPTTEEIQSVKKIDTPTMIPTNQFPKINGINIIIRAIQAKPISIPVLNSRRTILHKSRLPTVPRARPRTATVSDCVPTFPPESMIIGTNAPSNKICSSVSSNDSTIPAVIMPKNMSAMIQGERLRAAANALILISVAPLTAEISPKSSVVSSSTISITSSTVTIPSKWFSLETTGSASKSYFLIILPTSSWSTSSVTEMTRVLITSFITAFGGATIKSRNETTPTSRFSESTTYK